MSFQPVLIQNLPPGDEVFYCPETNRYIKTRVVRLDDSGHPAEIRAKNIFLHVSGSACDADGWALPDGAGGHCIAPEKSVTLSIPEIHAAAATNNRSPVDELAERFFQLRMQCCIEAAGIDDVIALKMSVPVKQPAGSQSDDE